MNMREKIAREMFRGFVSDKPAVWLTLSKGARDHWLAFADAALVALRDPTEEMLQAAERFVVHDPDTEGLNEYSDDLWRAMIDAAKDGA